MADPDSEKSVCRSIPDLTKADATVATYSDRTWSVLKREPGQLLQDTHFRVVPADQHSVRQRVQV